MNRRTLRFDDAPIAFDLADAIESAFGGVISRDAQTLAAFVVDYLESKGALITGEPRAEATA